ncbi:transposase [Peribacillus sp. FSL K6-1552]|uniref:transposase n=1 Tax=Peribacillus sp. FSL K6-1552 TaxID=2954514 RepID=UPI0040468ADF
MTKLLQQNPNILHFIVSKSIWRSIYSTNLIESINKQIKKYSKRNKQFPNEESL